MAAALLEIIELAVLCASDKCFPLYASEDKDWPSTFIFCVANTDTIRREMAYLNAVTIHVTE